MTEGVRENSAEMGSGWKQGGERTLIDKLESSLSLPGDIFRTDLDEAIRFSKSILNMSPSKLRLDPSLSIKVLPHRCSSQTLFRLISPGPLFAEPLLATHELSGPK